MGRKIEPDVEQVKVRAGRNTEMDGAITRAYDDFIRLNRGQR